MKMNRGIARRALSLGLAAVMALSMTACAKKPSGESGGQQAQSAGDEKIVNVGVTDTLNTLNPLLMDGGEINKYATGLMFLPLMELDADLKFEGMLADSITAEDDHNFLVHIDDRATWSDGKPVTADDVVYTALRLTSPVIGNTAMMYYAFVGVGDDGYTEKGADHVEGIVKVDDKTVRFTTKDPMSLVTFQNSYARYLMTLPKHVIEGIAEEDLKSNEWFNHPDVTSGPFRVTDFDKDHYISYEANKDYWKGAPKIDRLNIKIVEGSQLYAGLKSGEIDVTQNTMSAIPMEDYESIEALENVTAVYGDPVTNQSVFIQTANVPDVRVRQAMLCAIDRNRILDQLMKGHGEVIDGFLSSASPYFDSSITPVSYDPERAKALLAEAGWDSGKTLKFYINSGDSTFINVASVITAQWAEVGIKANIQTVDFATLMATATSGDYDVLAVQYTYAPVDPFADINWLINMKDSWTGYENADVNDALSKVQGTNDTTEVAKLYSVVDKRVQEDVPMFSAYVISSLGAVNKRLTGVQPSVYGFFNHVEQWDVN
ncbi:MAG: ABC transporter substrate-binding protein [Enterocloster asparagiformis]|nr:ABC transporter substrate-binding protein [Enterocloster asparagiformis]